MDRISRRILVTVIFVVVSFYTLACGGTSTETQTSTLPVLTSTNPPFTTRITTTETVQTTIEPVLTTTFAEIERSQEVQLAIDNLNTVDLDVNFTDIFEQDDLTEVTMSNADKLPLRMSGMDWITGMAIDDPDPAVTGTVEITSERLNSYDENNYSLITTFAVLIGNVDAMTMWAQQVVDWMIVNMLLLDTWVDTGFNNYMMLSVDSESGATSVHSWQSNGIYFWASFNRDSENRKTIDIGYYIPDNVDYGTLSDIHYQFHYVEDQEYEMKVYVEQVIDQSRCTTARKVDDRWLIIDMLYTSIKMFSIENGLIYEMVPSFLGGGTNQVYIADGVNTIGGIVKFFEPDPYTDVWLYMKEFNGWEKMTFAVENVLGDITPYVIDVGTVYGWTTFGNGNLMNEASLVTSTTTLTTGDVFDDRIKFAGGNAYVVYGKYHGSEEYTLGRAVVVANFFMNSAELSNACTFQEFTDYLTSIGIANKTHPLFSVLEVAGAYCDGLLDFVAAYTLEFYGMTCVDQATLAELFMDRMHTAMLGDVMRSIEDYPTVTYEEMMSGSNP